MLMITQLGGGHQGDQVQVDPQLYQKSLAGHNVIISVGSGSTL